MFQSSSPCSPLCPWIHMDQDIGDRAITGSRGREFHTSIFHKPLTLQMSWSPAPWAACGCHHTQALLFLNSPSRRLLWVALDVSSPPCSPECAAHSRRVCSLSICSSLDAQFPDYGIFISTVSWLCPAATKFFFSFVHSHQQRVMCSVGVSGSWGSKNSLLYNP